MLTIPYTTFIAATWWLSKLSRTPTFRPTTTISSPIFITPTTISSRKLSRLWPLWSYKTLSFSSRSSTPLWATSSLSAMSTKYTLSILFYSSIFLISLSTSFLHAITSLTTMLSTILLKWAKWSSYT